MSTVLKKGAPSRSYPSRQRKLGPAPFASFEDLSDELESPADGGQAAGDLTKVDVMPEIREDTAHSPVAEEPFVNRSHKTVTATSSTNTVTFAASYSAPTSGPTSGLQTPSTPRIDISCASSSTPPSEDSASEKELFQGGLGFAFHEEGTEELRSSTEELDLGEVDIDSEEERRRKRSKDSNEMEEIFRRSSHPANIFTRRKSSNATGYEDNDDSPNRKPSAHSLFLDGLLSRPCRHASFGSADYGGRPGAISSLSAHSSGSFRGRSPSPHKMMLETSFCGSKPIPTKSMDMESPPKETHMLSEPEHVLNIEQNASFSPVSSNYLPTEPRSPRSPRSPRDFDRSRRPSSGRRSVSPFKMVFETSFCGSKPIPTKSMDQDSPPKDLPPDLGLSGQIFTAKTTLTTVQVHQHNIVHASASSPLTSPPEGSSSAFSSRKASLRATSPESPKSSDHWRPVSPRLGTSTTSPSSPTPCTSSTTANKVCRSNDKNYSPGGSAMSSSNQNKSRKVTPPSSKNDTNIFKWPEPSTSSSNIAPQNKPAPPKPPLPLLPSASASSKSLPKAPIMNPPPPPKPKGGAKANKDSSGTKSSKNGHERLENDEITTELKISEEAIVTVEDAVPIESKGLFHTSDSFDEDGDLPYVPTTLPQEKPSVVPIFPSKEQRSMSVTTPVQRPKVNRPANPASLHDYIVHSSVPKLSGEEDLQQQTTIRMKINLPRDDSLTDPNQSRSPKKKSATSWMDFAELGLRSPREIRRKMKEENGAGDDLSSYHRKNGWEVFKETMLDSGVCSDSSEAIAVAGHSNGSDDEGESHLKLPNVPFAMDLDVKSNCSSVVSQEDLPRVPRSPSVSSLPLESFEDSDKNQQD